MKSLLNLKAAVIAASLFLLTSCAAETEAREAQLYVPETEAGETDYEFITVELGSIIRDTPMQVQLESPVRRDLYFEQESGRLKGLYVREGDRVSEGGVLAEIVFDQEKLEAENKRLTLEREQFERRVAYEDEILRDGIIKAQAKAELADENGLEPAMIALRRAELTYEQFLYQNGQTRYEFNEQFEDLNEQIDGEQLLAPYDGTVTFVHMAQEGSLIQNWQRIAEIIDDSKIQMTIEGSVNTVRYGDIVHVSDRRETVSFDARVISDPIAMFSPLTSHTFTLEPVDTDALSSILDEDETLYSALSRLMLNAEVQAVNLQNMIVLPRSAIRPEDAKNFVYLYEDGSLKKRYVTVGLTYADQQQVINGLELGRQVVVSP